MTKQRKFIIRIFIIVGFLALVGFLIYSVRQYRQSGIAEKGIVTCVDSTGSPQEGGKCFWSAHIHVYLPIEICGQEYPLSKFQGPLAKHHTHGEENIIHWHDRLEFDPVMKQFLDPSSFLLSRTLETLQIPVSETTFLDKKDGDFCPNEKSGTWKTFINGAFMADWRNYEWKDHDIVFFIFDDRMIEEVEAELREKPQVFPKLGDG